MMVQYFAMPRGYYALFQNCPVKFKDPKLTANPKSVLFRAGQ
jgi:hypothetical protein